MNLPDPAILTAFDVLDDRLQVEPWGGGHIHASYRVTCRTGGYLLQCINRTVFKYPRLVMENIERVTRHTYQHLKKEGLNDEEIHRQTLTLIQTRNGSIWHQTAKGEWWRLYRFIRDSYSLEASSTPEVIYKAGQVIGRFQALLSDLPEPPLHTVIPHFHDTPRRLQALRQAQHRDVTSRAGNVRKELAYVAKLAEQAATPSNLLEQGKLPWRVTHNDAKLSNILFDTTSGTGLCLVDLDTVMPGSVLFDFGDAARSGASTAAEDEPDLTKINVDHEKYSALVEGYLSSAASFLTLLERDLLPLAPWMLAFEQGVRFLTDYLNGDIYYKVSYPEHNRVRAQNQLALADAFLTLRQA